MLWSKRSAPDAVLKPAECANDVSKGIYSAHCIAGIANSTGNDAGERDIGSSDVGISSRVCIGMWNQRRGCIACRTGGGGMREYLSSRLGRDAEDLLNRCRDAVEDRGEEVFDFCCCKYQPASKALTDLYM